GLSTTEGWKHEEPTGLYGDAVASAGDVNGDGFADLLVGARAQPNFGDERGRAFLYYGNGATHGGAAPRARTVADGPLPHLGVAPVEGFRIAMTSRTPFGRGRVKLRWETLPFGAPHGGVLAPIVRETDWADSGLAGVELDALAKDIPAGLYHWRARAVYDPSAFPYLPAGRWLSNPINGPEEADLRVVKGVP